MHERVEAALFFIKEGYNDHEYRGRFFIAGREYPTIDHVVPLVLGGKHSWTNVKLAHLSCNSAKGASVNG